MTIKREKMNRKERARQFAPFDALKGLQDALRLKQYEHERIIKKDVSEEQAEKISNILRDLKNNDLLKAVYFCDGHNKEICGKAKLDLAEQILQIDRLKINLNNIYDLEKMNNEENEDK